MFSKFFTTAFLAITALTSVVAYPSTTLHPRAVSVSPADLLAINHALQVVDSIPVSVLNEGDSATASWLETNGASIQIADSSPAISDVGASTDGLVVVQDAWDVIQCVAAVTEVIVTGIIPVAKLLRLKSIIERLGGIKKAIDALFASKGNMQNAAELVKELIDVITGIDGVRESCL